MHFHMQIPKLHAPRIIHDTMQEQKDIELSSYKSLDEVIRPRPSLSLRYGLHVTEFCYFVFLLSHALNFPSILFPEVDSLIHSCTDGYLSLPVT